MALLDHYGFGLSTGNAEAAEAYDKGARSFVAWRADTMDHLNAAIAADRDFTLPCILKAWILHGGRAARFDPVIDKLLSLVEPLLGVAGGLYTLINVGYSLGLKQVVLLDVFAVTSGYVIRAAAGAVAIDVTPSPWLYATTGAGALFIVLGRRFAEVRLAGDGAEEQRSVLKDYSGPFINQLLMLSAAAAWLSYTLYTVEATNLPENNTMLFTLPLVTFGLFRYLFLLNNSEQAEAPERLIVGDLPLVLSIMSWVAVSAVVLLMNN